MSIFGIGIDLLKKKRIYKFSLLKQKKLAKKILSVNELKRFKKKKKN